MDVTVVGNLLFIALISTFIIDFSGAIDSLKSGISWLITKGKISSSDYRLKPFDCSLCTNFWLSILYLAIVGKLSILYVAIVCVICSLIEVIHQTLLLLGDIFLSLIKFINKLLRKI